MAPWKAPAGQNASQGVANQVVVVGIQKDALKRSSAVHPTNQQAAAITHLVPPWSLPPHPPQSFNHMLPHHQQYDAYMHPTSTDPKLEPLDTRDTPLESDDVPIDPAIQEQESTILSTALPQDHSTDIEQMPPPPAKFNQFTPTKKSLATSAPSNNPFNVFTTGTRLESVSPMLTASSLTLLDALTTPLHLSSVAPQLSASNRHISATPTKLIASTCAAVVIPKWLTDTIRHLENDIKSHKEKLEETKDLQEQTAELNELRQLIATLRDDQTQLGEDVDKTHVSLDSVCSNIDVITKSLEGSGEPSKVKVAHAAGENVKDNIWNAWIFDIWVCLLSCAEEVFLAFEVMLLIIVGAEFIIVVALSWHSKFFIRVYQIFKVQLSKVFEDFGIRVRAECTWVIVGRIGLIPSFKKIIKLRKMRLCSKSEVIISIPHIIVAMV
ncbi:uncharacterized protein BJ212DRAFT_1299613 [Suillus subaureus]|uniref:Uncharacterized protein n=1 Tax=Suillus subaureus TaxID=48587 RepID=A0A9P7JDH1_9AGAM|nr:uncharacterized protein BJ212DRAFT_1299613 [Suillus subaureus]KAG1816310.1 hypothetical protein BJ212DRAFT_1299613 [Suillus subaureus]